MDFIEVFEPLSVITLGGSEDTLLALRDLRVAPDGRLIVTDRYEQHVRIHAPGGRLLRTVLGTDGNPHSQTTRIAVGGDRIYATCLDTDKLTVLDHNGRRLRSWAPEGFTPNEIQVDGEGNVFLGGHPSRADLPSHGLAIHRFSPNFDYEKSWFRRDPRSETLAGPAIAFFSLDIDAEGFIYAVQPLVYGITKYDRTGEVVREAVWDPKAAPYFREPAVYRGSPSPRAQRDWFQSWTQVLEVFASDRFVYLVLQTHAPKRFVIEVLDRDLNFLVRGVATDDRMLDVDAEGRVYLLLSDAPDRVGVFRPRM